MFFCNILQCLEPVNTLTAKDCSETVPAMNLSNQFFRVNNFGNNEAIKPRVFSKSSNFHVDS